MKCPHCNDKVDCSPNEPFCPNCGKMFKEEEISTVEIPISQGKKDVMKDGEIKGTQDEMLKAKCLDILAHVSDIPSAVTKTEFDGNDVLSPLSGLNKNHEFIPDPLSSDAPLNALENMVRTQAIPIDERISLKPKGLIVEYNTNIFLLKGVQTLLKLRLKPLDKDFRSLDVYMVTQIGTESQTQRINIDSEICPDESFEISHPYIPQITGTMKFAFYLECHLTSETKFYSFVVDHPIYDDPDQQSHDSISVSITNDHSTHVGDEGLRILKDPSLSTNEMIRRLNNLSPNYKLQPLRSTRWRPAYYRNSHQRLSLKWNGTTIYLIAKNKVSLGRSKDCDLVVRTGGGSIDARTYPNNTVSRYHAELHYENDKVILFDHSSNGTMVNGAKPTERGLPIPDNSTVEFGDIVWHMNIQRCSGPMSETCQSCACECKNVKAVTFIPQKDEHEAYLLVWQCCELGRVIKELAGWVVYRRHDAFFLQAPGQNVCQLRPGSPINACNQTINVDYFQQN